MVTYATPLTCSAGAYAKDKCVFQDYRRTSPVVAAGSRGSLEGKDFIFTVMLH